MVQCPEVQQQVLLVELLVLILLVLVGVMMVEQVLLIMVDLDLGKVAAVAVLEPLVLLEVTAKLVLMVEMD